MFWWPWDRHLPSQWVAAWPASARPGEKAIPTGTSCRKHTRAQVGWAKDGCSCYSATHLRGTCIAGFVNCAAFSGWVDNASVGFKRSVCQITDSRQWHLRAVNCETWEENVHILFQSVIRMMAFLSQNTVGFTFILFPHKTREVHWVSFIWQLIYCILCRDCFGLLKCTPCIKMKLSLLCGAT